MLKTPDPRLHGKSNIIIRPVFINDSALANHFVTFANLRIIIVIIIFWSNAEATPKHQNARIS